MSSCSRGHPARGAPNRARRGRPIGTEVDRLRTRRGRADLALFHEFAPPPSWRRASVPARPLERAREPRSRASSCNRISGGTPACLFNSFNFDFARLRRFADRGARMVHRVDGPIGVYRGFDDGTDERIAEVNAELAAATIFQSRFSLEKHRELGFELRDPVVVPNAVDPAIFHPPASREPLDGRRVRLIATSWSDNPRKGTDTLAWLDRNLDHERYELTFAGRSPMAFERIRAVGPLDSNELAALLRDPGRLHRPEPRRSVLERAPRGARVRTSSGLPRQRRPPRARRRGRPAVSRGRGAGGRPRATRRRARRAARGDRDPADLVGRRPLPGGARPGATAT